MARLALNTLGSLTLDLDGTALDTLRSQPAKALLVYLAVEAATAHRREALVELLWPGMVPSSGRQNLRQALYDLRHALPEVAARKGGSALPSILADRQTVQINPECDIWLDLEDFESLIKQGALVKAADLYRGDFLNDFFLPDSDNFEEWAATKRAYYRRQMLDALAQLAEWSLEKGEAAAAERFARRQIAIDSLREPAYRQLMLVLARSGRRVEAVSQYEALKQLLRQELHIEPEEQTSAIYRAITSGEEQAPAGMASPAIREAQKPIHNLSPQATPFVGRRAELAQIRQLIDDRQNRLLTLIGPGGSGKTRLAVEAAKHFVEHQSFPDGIWFVPLASLSEPGSIIQETAKSLGYRFFDQRDPKEQLLDYLREKQLLLVMDNYEHLLVDGQTPFAADIVKSAPSVIILATSRARLNAHGERLFPVGGLALPEDDTDLAACSANEAVQLFEQSARRVKLDFQLDSGNLAVVTRICRLIQGMPLGIELAAAWMELLSPEEIAAEIQRSLDFLEVDWQDLPERQRSLRAVFESSWKMLSPDEQHIVTMLSVFQGSFSREAAQHVSGATLKGLLSLTNKSWLNRGPDGYQIHVLLRQYGQEKLRQNPETWHAARTTHAQYHAGWLDGLYVQMRGPDQLQAFNALEQSFEDIRQAFHWLLEQEEWQTVAENMLPALIYCSTARTTLSNEMLQLVKEAQKRRAGEAGYDLLDAILDGVAAAWEPGYYAPLTFAGWNTSLHLPAELIQNSWEFLGQVPPDDIDALWLVLSAVLTSWQIDRDAGIERLRRLVDFYRDSSDRWALAFSVSHLGLMLSAMWFPSTAVFLPSRELEALQLSPSEESSYWREASRVLEEAEALWAPVGDRLQKAETVRTITMHAKRIARGLARTNANEEIRKLFREYGDIAREYLVLNELAQSHLYRNQFARAFEYFREMRALFERIGSRAYLCNALSNESIVALRYSTIEHARQLRMRCLAIAQEIDDLQQVGWSLWELGDLERVAGNNERARQLFEESLPMFEQLETKVGQGFYHRGIGEVARTEGDLDKASDHLLKAVAYAREARHDWTVAYCLASLSRITIARGELETAWQQLLESLRISRLAGFREVALITLATAAYWYTTRDKDRASSDDRQRALTLAHYTANNFFTWREHKKWAAELANRAASELPAEAAATAKAQADGLDLSAAVILAVSL